MTANTTHPQGPHMDEETQKLASICRELGLEDGSTEAQALAAIKAMRLHIHDLTHQVICCGVAASHPDADLTTRGHYAGKWNSAQAEEVRKLRADRDRLRFTYAPRLRDGT